MIIKYVPELDRRISQEGYLLAKMKWYHNLMWYSWIIFVIIFPIFAVDYAVSSERELQSHTPFYVIAFVFAFVIVLACRTVLGRIVSGWKVYYDEL